MFKRIYLLVIFIFSLSVVFAQSETNFPKQKFSFAFDGGLSIGFTDYQEQNYGPVFRGGLQYFLYPATKNRIGLGFQFSYQQIKGEDQRTTIFSLDGLREISPTFSTSIISPGLFSEYSYLFTERFFAYVRLGFTYNVFNPKNNKGEDAWAYDQGIYDKDFFTISPELGFKFRVDNNLDLSAGLNYSLAVTDYLDDIATSTKNDSYVNILFGLSYSFIQQEDEKPKTIYEGIKPKHEEIITIPEVDEQQKVIIEQPDEKIAKDILPIEILTEPKDEKDNVIPPVRINEILLPGDETFQDGSASFEQGVYSELDRIVELINIDPDSRWRIEGHMDSQGVVTTIKKLSQERARAVHDYFVSKGIQASRLRVYGLADNFPIANNNTAEGRRTNRRTMIIREK
ncbi:MAG: OmpA family protein [Ignavibacteriaceae bacterium]|nr:OmpA family protein [Ignavibacteriaceae bacterium]